MMGQGGGHGGGVAREAGLAGQGLAVGGVQTAPLTREHVLVDRVPGERVPERVAAARMVDHQQVALDGLAQSSVEVRFADAGDLGQQAVGNTPARDRRGPQ